MDIGKRHKNSSVVIPRCSRILGSELICIGVLVVTALAAKLGTIVILDIEPRSDMLAYLNMARTTLASGRMEDGMGNLAFYSAGYPLFLVPFFALFGGSATVAQMVNVLLGGISAYLVYLCGREVLGNWKWAILPAMVWIIYPPNLVYTEYIFKENLMVPLLLGQTLLLLRHPWSARPSLSAIALGGIFGLELLAGPAIILTGVLVAIVVLGVGWSGVNFKKRAYHAVLCTFSCFVILSPWLLYTTYYLGQPVLNTNGAFNLYLGNNPSATVSYTGIQDTPRAAQWHSLRKEKGEIVASEALGKAAVNYIWNNPVDTTILSLKKIGYFWTPPLHKGESANPSWIENAARTTWLFLYITIVMSALIPVTKPKRLDRRAFLLYGTALTYCATFAIAYVIFRYRLPVMPIMVLLSAMGLQILWQERQLKTERVKWSPKT